jgi:DNA-binding NarL/FixJ family response regulator
MSTTSQTHIRSTIAIADAHELMRKGVVATLLDCPQWQVLGEAADGRQALDLCRTAKPDILLLDVDLPEVSGLQVIRTLHAECPLTRTVVLSSEDSEQIVRDALAAGALGYVLKSDSARDVVIAIDSVLGGHPFFTSRVTEAMLNVYVGDRPAVGARERMPVTMRERQIVNLIAAGQTSKEIAVSLAISVRTVETHRSNILDKLGLHSARELLVYAVRHGWVNYSGMPLVNETEQTPPPSPHTMRRSGARDERLGLGRPVVTPVSIAAPESGTVFTRLTPATS